ncbi:unnamed protein product [Symbiodinium sp. CCMP2592]|nr:unnamed protein product [Symbiodinium sp. CCMP2592]
MWPLCAEKQAENLTEKFPAEDEAVEPVALEKGRAKEEAKERFEEEKQAQEAEKLTEKFPAEDEEPVALEEGRAKEEAKERSEEEKQPQEAEKLTEKFPAEDEEPVAVAKGQAEEEADEPGAGQAEAVAAGPQALACILDPKGPLCTHAWVDRGVRRRWAELVEPVQAERFMDWWANMPNPGTLRGAPSVKVASTLFSRGRQNAKRSAPGTPLGAERSQGRGGGIRKRSARENGA